MAKKQVRSTTRRPRLQVMLNSRMMRMPVSKVDRIVRAANTALRVPVADVLSESKRTKVNFLLRQDNTRLTKLMLDKNFIPKAAFEKIKAA